MEVIVDCDTGIDDAFALMYLTAHPQVTIVAAGSIWGNVPAAPAALNTLRVLELCGAGGVPVAVGAATPLAKAFIPYDGVHGADGLGNTGQPAPAGGPAAGSAAEQLVRLAREHPGRLTVVATGPLTNVALAHLLEPRLSTLLNRVVVMGGAVDAPGNVTALAEANIWGDPEAAKLVLNSGLAVTLVGLDVTMGVLLEEEALRVRRDRSAAGAFASAVAKQYFDFYEPRTLRRAAPPHDLVAAVLAVEPELATYDQATVEVLTSDDTARGKTVVDRRSWADRTGPVSVARTVDAERILRTWMDALDSLP
ncbi:MAG: Inosine/uridine-preferring nucleoside hydrolase [Dactylosporangium sp.]|jgi:purine nucleosidase|nr:Inosine/uridine-preferring nucleoside hydrolase [Dactylosporangium sp.]